MSANQSIRKIEKRAADAYRDGNEAEGARLAVQAQQARKAVSRARG